MSSDAENRYRFVGGLFVQRQEHDIQQRYKIDGLAPKSPSRAGTTPSG